MNASGVKHRDSLTAKILAATLCLVAMLLIAIFLDAVWRLSGSNHDLPPTWYLALVALLIAVDVAAMCYIGFRIFSKLIGRISPWQTMRIGLLLVFLLGALHAMTAFVYSSIPQWDFQDSLFDDLSRPRAGRISQDCSVPTAASPQQLTTASSSEAPGYRAPISYEEVQRIARTSDWRVRQNEWKDSMVVGWRGWVQDTARHGYYSNPDHRLLTLYLYDPYSDVHTRFNNLLAGLSQRPEAVVSYFAPNEIAKLAVGQEVLLCGRISEAEVLGDGDLHVSIDDPVVNPLPMPEALGSTQIPNDFIMEYEAHGCGEGYVCAEYKLRIDADGNVSYEGFANVMATGTHTMRTSKEKVKEIVFELQRNKFLSVNNLPEELEGDPSGATVLRARMDGTTKTIVLPWRSVVWPAGVRMIIGKIEEASNLHQWVNLVKSR